LSADDCPIHAHGCEPEEFACTCQPGRRRRRPRRFATTGEARRDFEGQIKTIGRGVFRWLTDPEPDKNDAERALRLLPKKGPE
jgi:hypothetical protein